MPCTCLRLRSEALLLSHKRASSILVIAVDVSREESSPTLTETRYCLAASRRDSVKIPG